MSEPLEQSPHRKPRRIWAIVGIIAGIVVIAAAIWMQQQRAVAPVGRSTTDTSRPQQRATDFEVTMYQGQGEVGGQKVRLSQILARGKPVVLNFFAGLCPPCRAEMPDFQRRYETGGKDKYIMLTVDVGPYVGLGTRDQGKAFLEALRITFPAGTVFDEDIINAYQIVGMPSTFFITPDGMIVRKQIGLLTAEQMDTYIAELIASGRK